MDVDMQTMMFNWGVLAYDTFKVLLLRPIILIINIDVGVKLAYHNYINIKMGPKIDYGRRQDIGPLVLGAEFFIILVDNLSRRIAL